MSVDNLSRNSLLDILVGNSNMLLLQLAFRNFSTLPEKRDWTISDRTEPF